ncbi:MAG: polyphosphate kinase 2 family protein [Bacilli bacterium]|nr:polyphosphate kinase 2 family protein [Bacilli bacterium]
MGIARYAFKGKRRFNIRTFDTGDTGEFTNREEAVNEFVENLLVINKKQQKLYSERKEGVIFVFQAMDAAGKDGVIRTVFSTLSPHGVKEYCFKVPSAEEKSHDFLWRFWSALPPRGFISIFNRSYYEDVLVGKVHAFYKHDIVPDRMKEADIIAERYRQINDFEKYLYETGTRVVKIFLNVSKDEQARRFISRIDTQRKNWKVSSGDLKEREYWDDYMEAFETMVNETSTKNSPWYVVPADHKWFARLLVSRIVKKTLEEIDPQYPPLDEATATMLQEYRKTLIESLGGEDYYKEQEKQPKEFSDPSLIPAEMLQQEALQKQQESEERLKQNGFKAVRKLLATNYMIRSLNDIVEAVAQQGDEDRLEPSSEEGANEEENTRDAAEIREHIKEIVEANQEDDDNA